MVEIKMLLTEIFMMIEAPWRQYGTHKGVQYHTVTAAEKKAAADKEAAKEAKKVTAAEKRAIVKAAKEKAAKTPKEKKPRIPRFGSAKPNNEIEKMAKDAMYDVWQQIAPDIYDAIGEVKDPYELAELCYDASRLQLNGGLSKEDEEKVLKLPRRTLARLASDFGN
jgi:sRNA-binding protein